MKAVCITHAEDADGLICAAYLRHLRKASVMLMNYDKFEEALKTIQPPLKDVYICDLNIREELFEEIKRIKGFAEVTIVDHHPTAAELLARLSDSGVVVVHNTLDCASILLYNRFKEELERKAARLAAYAAVSDQFEDGPLASKLLAKLDRQYVKHEALILTHALHRKVKYQFRLSVVEELSNFTPPHRIKGVLEASTAYLEQVTELLNTLPRKASGLERLAYDESIEGMSVGAVAGLLLDAMDVDVGVCYKPGKKGAMNLSIRGKLGLKTHLGRVTKSLAKRYGGFGGGHSRASGASIPSENYMSFIQDLDRELEKTA